MTRDQYVLIQDFKGEHRWVGDVKVPCENSRSHVHNECTKDDSKMAC